MQLRELITTLNSWDDKAGIWAFPSHTLNLLFREDVGTMLKALARHQEAGVIQRVARGLYVNPRARSLPPDVLSALVPFIRPWDFNYLSLESVLSEAGWISQVPSRLTLMSTGRSETFGTPYGTLEFVHTARDPESIVNELTYDSQREMTVATPARALRDLNRVGRNRGLVTSMENNDATSYAH